jgi:hypothetical protein
MPVAVKALWESADRQAQEAAHATCTAILETWLGKTSRQEVAERLGISRLRLWQLSQQAVAGMLAGVLKQPRARRGAGVVGLPPEDDPMELKKELEQVKRELKLAEELIVVLRELPGHREQRPKRKPPKRRAAKGRKTGTRRRTSGGKKSPGTRVAADDASADAGALAG